MFIKAGTGHNRKEILIEAARDHAGIIYSLRDDSAIVVVDNSITTIGSEPLLLNAA